ncbi:MAG: AfsR/SARP family transcriptional regulator [Candidatus Eiseniibacteriota bacterium]
MGRLEISVLGGFGVKLASGEAVSVSTRKAQALLAYLAVHPGQAHPRDKLATLLWSNSEDARARASLRQTLSALGKALVGIGDGAIVTDGNSVALNSAVTDVDVAAFEQALTDGTPEALEKAADLYRGDLLDGLGVDEPVFEDWLLGERERLRELAIDGLAKLLAHQMKTDATERAIRTAVRLLALEPLQEVVHRGLMRLYARQGRRGAALKQYQICVAVLQRELD